MIIMEGCNFVEFGCNFAFSGNARRSGNFCVYALIMVTHPCVRVRERTFSAIKESLEALILVSGTSIDT